VVISLPWQLGSAEAAFARLSDADRKVGGGDRSTTVI
jgi:hypothetical protein